MPQPNAVLDQPERLAAIHASALVQAGVIPALDRVVAAAARMLDVPVAQLNVVTADRQIPVSHVGGDAWGHEVRLDRSFCQHAIRSGEPLVVEDAREHPLVAASPATRESGIVGYLSIPILSPRARVPLATLCAVDFRPRAWTERDVAILTDLSAWARTEIELRAAALRDRNRAEAVLREREAHLQAIYDGTYEYIGLLAPDGTLLETNRASLEFGPATRAEAVGRPFWEGFWFAATPGLPERVREGVESAARGEFVRFEARLLGPTGAAATFDISLHPVRDAEGKVLFIVPEGRDITDRVRAEEALRASEARYRALFESLDDGFCVVEVRFQDGRAVDYRYLEANPAFARHTGLSDVVGRWVSEVIPGTEREGIAAYGGVAVSGEPVRFEAHVERLRKWFDVSAFRLGPAEDRQVAILFRDVSAAHSDATERERLLRESEQARREAEAARAEAEMANRVKAEFLATMSHELRTPLNAIGGYTELMEMGIRGPVTAEQREDLHRIQQSQKHLLGLINEVLNYAKLETGSIRYDVRPVPVAEALTETQQLVAPQARAKSIALTVAATCPPGLAARADPEKLRQILVNLVGNAVKFTLPGGRVEISCAREGASVVFRVRDTGIGIPPEKLESVFDPFVQVRSDLTRTHEGTGLGLAISRDLALGMGGDLAAESTPGVGSTFTVTLPAA